MQAAAKRHMRDPDSRSFFLGNARTERTSRAMIEKCYLLMTPAEATKQFGRKLRQKDPVLRQIDVVDVDGSQERCYVFRDDENAVRRLRVQTEVAEIDETVLMDCDQHLHEEQGALLKKSALKKRMAESKLEGLWSAGAAQAIVSVQEYQRKLDAK